MDLLFTSVGAVKVNLATAVYEHFSCSLSHFVTTKAAFCHGKSPYFRVALLLLLEPPRRAPPSFCASSSVSKSMSTSPI